MALTFTRVLPSAGSGTARLTFDVPSGHVPAEFRHGALTVVSQPDAEATIVYAVDISAALNPAIAAQTVPAEASSVLFSENGWVVLS